MKHQLEQGVVDIPDGSRPDVALQVEISKALSLKRIADFLERELTYSPNTRNLFDALGGHP